MAVLATDDVVRAQIRDVGPGLDPAALHDVPFTGESAKRLKIVGALADRWGVESRDETTVWLRLDRLRE